MRTASEKFTFPNFDNVVAQNLVANPRHWGKDLNMPMEPAESESLNECMARYAGGTVTNALDGLLEKTLLDMLSSRKDLPFTERVPTDSAFLGAHQGASNYFAQPDTAPVIRNKSNDWRDNAKTIASGQFTDMFTVKIKPGKENSSNICYTLRKDETGKLFIEKVSQEITEQSAKVTVQLSHEKADALGYRVEKNNWVMPKVKPPVRTRS